MVNVCRVILQHIKEYCEEAAIHGPQHIVAHRLAVFERLVPIQLAFDCTVHDYICLEKIIAELEALITYSSDSYCSTVWNRRRGLTISKISYKHSVDGFLIKA